MTWPTEEGRGDRGGTALGRAVLERLLPRARHAANNLSMVLVSNLEAADAAVARGGADPARLARQVSRALAGARDYDGLVRTLLGLSREDRASRATVADYLAEVGPLLDLAASRRLRVEVAPGGGGARAVLDLRRPSLDAALALATFEAPPVPGGAAEADLRAEGATLAFGWPVGEAAGAALRAAGAEVAPDGRTVALPQPAAVGAAAAAIRS